MNPTASAGALEWRFDGGVSRKSRGLALRGVYLLVCFELSFEGSITEEQLERVGDHQDHLER